MLGPARTRAPSGGDGRAMDKVDDRLDKTQYVYFNILAAIVGVTCGIVAIGFRYLILGMSWLFQTGNGSLHPWPIFLLIIFIPALGGLLAGLIIYHVAPEAKGHGVPEVMEAMHLHGGKMRWRVIGAKAFASALTIGSGGSSGREGPIVHMSSALGSSVGRSLGLTTYHVKILVGCGAAGAISATFNTPLAGILFAIELILPEVRTRSFIPVVISSVFANVTSWTLLRALGIGEVFVFGGAGGSHALQFQFHSPLEMIFYLALGLLAGLVAILYIRWLYSMEDAFDRMNVHPVVKPAIGGLLVGVIGVLIFWRTGSFRVFGVGYESIRWVLDFEVARLSWWLFILLASLVILKVLATSLTLGSGGSGGVFAPALFTGAMLGGAVGVAVNLADLPFEVGHPGAYALVGMAAVFAGASRATLTSIVIIFEMTGDYFIIIPLMFACVIADGVAVWGFRDSIYSMKLSRRGVHIRMDREADVMDQISVREVMHRRVEVVSPQTPLQSLMDRMIKTGHMGFPVVRGVPKSGKMLDLSDPGGPGYRLVGIVTHKDLQKAFGEGRMDARVGDVMTRDVVAVRQSMTLEAALLSTGWRPLNHLPVVKTREPDVLIGFLTKGDILRAYRFRRVMMHEQCTSLTRGELRAEYRRRRRKRAARLVKLRKSREMARRLLEGKEGDEGNGSKTGEEGGRREKTSGGGGVPTEGSGGQKKARRGV